MEIWQAAILVLVGMGAGFLNAVAGGGSLITLPALIFLGLDPATANATNRVSVLALTGSGTAGYWSKGIFPFPINIWYGVAAIPGALLGAWLSLDISGDLFNKILAGVMILVLAMILIKPVRGKTGEQAERMAPKNKILGGIFFFIIGIYGGFIQAGMGFMALLVTSMVHRMDLVKGNSIKLTVSFIYTVAVLGFFIYQGKIEWVHGLVLAAGTSIGAFFGSRWTAGKGDKIIKIFLVVMVVASAVKLLFFQSA